MGIRFLCPNGHKLNVKADLAGRRAICPTCGAKLVVPSVSGGVAEATASSSTELPLAAPSGVGVTGKSPAATADVHPEKPPQAGAWFVRPTSGGQFGPASDEVFGDWIREGRVTANAHVWRDGWPQWKLVRDVAGMLPIPLAATAPPPSPPPVAKFVEPAAEQPAPLPELQGEATLPASRYRASRLRKDKTQMTLAILMLVALIVLAAVLLWVVLRSGESTQGRLQSEPSEANQDI
jgi:hypothetical protein